MKYQEILAYAKEQEAICRKNDVISDKLFEEYGVNRGLRDQDGKGVLTGLTNISKMIAFKNVNGKKVPCEGRLWYRGYPIEELVEEAKVKGFGFELVKKDYPIGESYVLYNGKKIGELWEYNNIHEIATPWHSYWRFHQFIDDVYRRYPEILNLEWKGVEK